MSHHGQHGNDSSKYNSTNNHHNNNDKNESACQPGLGACGASLSWPTCEALLLGETAEDCAVG